MPESPGNHFERSKSLAAQHLSDLMSALNKCRFESPLSWTMTAEQLRACDHNGMQRMLDEVGSTYEKRPVLYYVALNNASLAKKCRDAFAARPNGRAYPQDNQHDSRFAYVGKSLNIRSRLKEHLGLSHVKTYGLQLLHWTSPNDLAFTFNIAEMTFAELNQSTAVKCLQIFEDTMWDDLRPMFGKRGAR